MINFGNSQSSGDSNFKLDDLEDFFAFDPKSSFTNKTIWNLSRNKKPVLRTQRFRDKLGVFLMVQVIHPSAAHNQVIYLVLDELVDQARSQVPSLLLLTLPIQPNARSYFEVSNLFVYSRFGLNWIQANAYVTDIYKNVTYYGRMTRSNLYWILIQVIRALFLVCIRPCFCVFLRYSLMT